MPGFIGLPEIILLGLVALILFGPKRLPEMGRGLGKGMREFKDSIGGDHGLNETKLELPGELTAAPTAPEPIAAVATDLHSAELHSAELHSAELHSADLHSADRRSVA